MDGPGIKVKKIIYILLVGVSALSSTFASPISDIGLKCPTTTRCSCDEDQNRLQISCPSIIITIYPSKSIHISCDFDDVTPFNESYYDNIPKMEMVNIYKAETDSCPESIEKTILKKFGTIATITIKNDKSSGNFVHENVHGGKFINNDDLNEIPEDFFMHSSRSKSEKVRFDNNSFVTLPEKLFKCLNNVRNISIFNDSLSVLPEGIFRGIPNLITIRFELNNLTTLPKKLFVDQTNLQFLIIKHNHLKTLEDGLLEHTCSLMELDLSFNHLESISGSIFRRLNNLIKLDLESNSLIHIETNAFSSLKSIEWINLYNNSLTLEDNMNGTLKNQSHFSSCDSLESLLLGRNKIKAINPAWSLLNLKTLDLSFNQIEKVGLENIPQKLTSLNLKNNHIKKIDLDVLKKLDKNPEFQELYLSGKHWKCDCENSKSVSFIQTFIKVKDLNEFQCKINEALCSTETYLAVVIIIAALGFSILIVVILAFYYQQEIKAWLFAHSACAWWVNEEVLDRDKTYDAFISYSHKDEDFVENQLIPQLESGPQPFRLCVHIRDWLGGDVIPNQIERSVNNSRRTIIVLSPDFLQSQWGRYEFRMAYTNSLAEGRARIILIMYGDIDMDSLDDQLKSYIRTNTYLKWGTKYFWNQLRYAMPHNAARGEAREKRFQSSVKWFQSQKLSLPKWFTKERF